MFVGIFGVLIAIAAPLLQESGAFKLNWWQALIVYILLVAISVWSFRRPRHTPSKLNQ